MLKAHGHECAICSEQRCDGQFWFLIAANPWEDKIRVFAWQEEAAYRQGMLGACCTDHAEELILHWTSGSLDPLFAFDGTVPSRSQVAGVPLLNTADTSGMRELAELCIDRDSVARVLNQNPGALNILLNELSDVLERAASGTPVRLE